MRCGPDESIPPDEPLFRWLTVNDVNGDEVLPHVVDLEGTSVDRKKYLPESLPDHPERNGLADTSEDRFPTALRYNDIDYEFFPVDLPEDANDAHAEIRPGRRATDERPNGDRPTGFKPKSSTTKNALRAERPLTLPREKTFEACSVESFIERGEYRHAGVPELNPQLSYHSNSGISYSPALQVVTLIQYPSFDGRRRSGTFWVFGKYDGSNVRAEWSRKRSKREPETFGFYKFGKRNGLLDGLTPHLIKAKDLILDLYGEDLDQVFMKRRLERATVFFEFYGHSSAFGYHVDEDHTVSLIDCHIHKQGFLPPKIFVEWFGHLHHAPLLHVGNVTDDLVRSVKDSTLDRMPFEGVVCKGNPDKQRRPVMFKIKSDAWYDALRNRCELEPDPYAAFERLK